MKIVRYPRRAPYRFPRKAEGINDPDPAVQQAYRQALSEWERPEHLTKTQRKAIYLLSLGRSVNEVARKVHRHPDSVRRWKRTHTLFRITLHRRSLAIAQSTAEALDAELPRAVGIIDDMMHSGDIMLEYTAAKDLLRGRGHYTQNIQKKAETHTTSMQLVKHEHGLSQESLKALVDALTQKTIGAPVAQSYAALPAPSDASVIDASPLRHESDEEPAVVREL